MHKFQNIINVFAFKFFFFCSGDSLRFIGPSGFRPQIQPLQLNHQRIRFVHRYFLSFFSHIILNRKYLLISDYQRFTKELYLFSEVIRSVNNGLKI